MAKNKDKDNYTYSNAKDTFFLTFTFLLREIDVKTHHLQNKSYIK